MDYLLLSSVVFGILFFVGIAVLPKKSALGFTLLVVALFVISNLLCATPGVDSGVTAFFNKYF